MTDDEIQTELKDGIEKLRKANPKLTREAAFNMLRNSRPELFSDARDVKASVPYRFVDPGQKKTTIPIRNIVDRMGAERVEAGREE